MKMAKIVSILTNDNVFTTLQDVQKSQTLPRWKNIEGRSDNIKIKGL